MREDLAAYVTAIVEGAGPGVDVALDCHWRYDLSTARLVADVVRDTGVLWLEDPLAPADVGGLVELSRSVGVPLATGENLQR